MKLCLGTVQFGLDYGLHGKHKPAQSESVSLLDYAVRHGVDAIDTSALYGDAERIVGTFLSRCAIAREKLFLVSKFGTAGFDGLAASDCEELLIQRAHETLARIGTPYLDALICHVPTAVYDDRIIQSMIALRDTGLARRVGFSVYETSEAAEAIGSEAIDFLQLPFSILDQRMAYDGILDSAAQKGIVLHSRSAYLQGVALMDADTLPERLAALRPALLQLDRLCTESGASRQELTLAFVRSFPQISHLVFGIHDEEQLAETIAAFSAEVPAEIIGEARVLFHDIAPELVMPNKWNKK